MAGVPLAAPRASAPAPSPDGAATTLSYWSDYFDPAGRAARPGYSTGWIAERLYGVMRSRGRVDYWDSAERPTGRQGDLFVGHFWSFFDQGRANDFDRRVAVYVLSNPRLASAKLAEAARRRGVPYPDWDLPPPHFDHDATMELADAVILVGNGATLESFEPRWRDKISLVNYAPGERSWPEPPLRQRPKEFIYVATNCGLRKGFLDVVDTWREVSPRLTRLHVVGHLEEPYRSRLVEANVESVRTYGWIPSTSRHYRELLSSCRFAYLPTWVEGQMGTLLEVIAAGCVPITTRASGVDDRVLEHCVLVDPEEPARHREAIASVLAWSDDEFCDRQAALKAAFSECHTWSAFEEGVRKVLWRDE